MSGLLQPVNGHKRGRLLLDVGDKRNPNAAEDLDDNDIFDGVLTKEGFENAIKLATDNKINDRNTWQVYLIEYFYEMNQLRSDDGVSINFQKASTTLDGCMKIISKRIDSAAKDLEILVIGMSNKNAGKRKTASGDEGHDSDSDEDYTDGTTTKNKKAEIRIKSGKSSLASDFNDIRLKEKLKEGFTDPLYRKAVSDFDEGGAKSLLLNSLRMSKQGKILLDEVTTKNTDKNKNLFDEYEEGTERKPIPDHVKSSINLNLNKLKSSIIDDSFPFLQVCNEAQQIRNILLNDDLEREFVDKLNDNKGVDDDTNYNPYSVKPVLDIDFNVDNLDSGFDFERDAGATDQGSDIEMMAIDGSGEHENEHELNEKQQSIMSFLDTNFAKKGTHWKIHMLKKKIAGSLGTNSEQCDPANQEIAQNGIKLENIQMNLSNKSKSKKKSEVIIDFMEDSIDASEEKLFKKSQRRIDLQDIDKVRNYFTTLPDANCWNSERLVKSLLKPNRRFRNIFASFSNRKAKTPIHADTEFWANRYGLKDPTYGDAKDLDQDANDFLNEVMQQNKRTDDYVSDHENFLNDEGLDEVGDYGDYDFDTQLPSTQTHVFSQSQTPSKLISLRKEGITYSKVSKRVDIRLLKQNLWEATIGRKFEHEDVNKISDVISNNRNDKLLQETGGRFKVDVKLSEVVQDAVIKYSPNQRKDLSTSFFFICMLHIANEHDLIIQNSENFTDLVITDEN